jgi:hypothetical protein
MKQLAMCGGVLALMMACGCAPRTPIDPNRNEMLVGTRERHGEQQIHRLLRERTRIYREPELVVRYFERMEERLAPAPIEGELVLGQIRESTDAWERFLEGTR